MLENVSVGTLFQINDRSHITSTIGGGGGVSPWWRQHSTINYLKGTGIMYFWECGLNKWQVLANAAFCTDHIYLSPSPSLSSFCHRASIPLPLPLCLFFTPCLLSIFSPSHPCSHFHINTNHTVFNTVLWSWWHFKCRVPESVCQFLLVKGGFGG